jgi:EmrB/QacA subfamily drug resistance transporter
MDRKWWTLIAVCIGTFMLLLDITIVNVALPEIQRSLKASFSDLQWVVDAYALMLAALLLTTGSLADLWGRRRLFVFGLVVFSLSSLMSGLAQDPLWLNLSRGAQGIGGAAMFSTSLALLGTSFQGRERGTAFGVWGAITGIAVAIGPVVGGALTTGISWRWIFLVNVPIGVIAVLITLWRVDETRRPGAPRPDLLGALTFSGSLACLVYALIEGDTLGWSSDPVLGTLIGSGVLFLAFIVIEAIIGERAMFDLSLLRKPTFGGGLVAAFALSAGLFALFLYLTLYLQDVLGYSALQTGLRFLVLSGGILLTSTLAGRLTAWVPIRLLIAPGLGLVGLGLVLMHGLSAASSWTHLIPGFIVAGAGTGLVNPPLASTAIGVVRPDRSGMASGINSTFRQVGIATGIAGLGALFAHSVRTRITTLLTGAPGVSKHAASSLASSVSGGNGAVSGLRSLPARARPAAVHALRAGFASGLNDVFVVGAILCFAGALLTLVLIRSRDFEEGAARTAPDSQTTADQGEQQHEARKPAQPAEEPVVVAAVQAGPAGEGEVDIGPGTDGGSGGSEARPQEPIAVGAGGGAPAARVAVPVRMRAWPPVAGAAPSDSDQERPRDEALGTPAAIRTTLRRAEHIAEAAEYAASVYLEEIGRVRDALAEAAEHLDRANAAREELNRRAEALIGRLPERGAGPESGSPPSSEPGPVAPSGREEWASEPHRVAPARRQEWASEHGARPPWERPQAAERPVPPWSSGERPPLRP